MGKVITVDFGKKRIIAQLPTTEQIQPRRGDIFFREGSDGPRFTEYVQVARAFTFGDGRIFVMRELDGLNGHPFKPFGLFRCMKRWFTTEKRLLETWRFYMPHRRRQSHGSFALVGGMSYPRSS